MNTVIYKGRICNDLVLLNSDKGCYVQFTLAVPRQFANGTDFIKCVAFKTIAKMLRKHSRKGDLIIVQGVTRTSVWSAEFKDGKRKIYQSQTVVQFVDLLDYHKDPIELPSDLAFLETLEDRRYNNERLDGYYEAEADMIENQPSNGKTMKKAESKSKSKTSKKDDIIARAATNYSDTNYGSYANFDPDDPRFM